jgi:putative phosphoesterase
MSPTRSAQRVAVLSDVHGNAVALEAVLDELAREADVDLVVFGGDLTWGPLPNETLELVDDLAGSALFIRGNAERALLEPSAEPTPRERWLADLHAGRGLAFVASFPEQLVVDVAGLGPVRFCHGSPRSDEELVTHETPETRVEAMTAEIDERVLVTAHTHLQFDRHVAGIRSINAGSVGMPYEGRPGSFWAILGPDVELRRTEYSLELASERYRASGDPLAEEMVELLISPPSREEVVEHAERVEFAG